MRYEYVYVLFCQSAVCKHTHIQMSDAPIENGRSFSIAHGAGVWQAMIKTMTAAGWAIHTMHIATGQDIVLLWERPIGEIEAWQRDHIGEASPEPL